MFSLEQRGGEERRGVACIKLRGINRIGSSKHLSLPQLSINREHWFKGDRRNFFHPEAGWSLECIC